MKHIMFETNVRNNKRSLMFCSSALNGRFLVVAYREDSTGKIENFTSNYVNIDQLNRLKACKNFTEARKMLVGLVQDEAEHVALEHALMADSVIVNAPISNANNDSARTTAIDTIFTVNASPKLGVALIVHNGILAPHCGHLIHHREQDSKTASFSKKRKKKITTKKHRWAVRSHSYP